MKQVLCLLLVVLCAVLGCSAPGTDANGSRERLGTAKSALTTLDTTPDNLAFAAFGQDVTAVPSFGQVVTVPAVDIYLRNFGIEMFDVPASVVFRAEVYAWDGTKATGASLYESLPVSTTGPTVQTVMFDTGKLALVAGAQYVLFVTASKDAGAGSGRWGTRTDNPYAGGTWVTFSGTAAQWTSLPWTANPAYDLAFKATFDGPVASSTALVSSVNPSVFGQSVTFTATVTGGAGTPDGTITFKDGAATLGTATLNGAGQASYASAALTVATHSITAVYGGNINYLTSTSPPVSQVVNKAATTTALVSSVNPSIVGGNVTFTATVTASSPGAGIPSGSITFREGATTLGTGNLDAFGVTTFSTSSLAPGSHTILADYGADARFTGSTSPAVVQVVNQDGATVSLSSSLNPSTFGTTVTFTAKVSSNGSGGTPSGTVNFKDGAAVLGTGVLDGFGNASFATSALSAGSHAIGADYGGDTKHSAASGSLTQTVNLGPSTTTSASLTNPSTFGQSVTFTAKVTGTGGTPSGTVTFLDGGSPLNSTILNASGQASFTTSALAVGTHAITIAYGGDSNFGASTSNTTSQMVTKANTTTRLATSSNPSIVGSSVTFTATVASVAPGAGTPAGTVTFREGATILGTGPVIAGVATFTTTALAAGMHTITADYGGSASANASTSNNVTQVVNQDGVTAQVTSSLSPSTFGTSVTFQATVTSVGPGGIPTGTVTFKDGAAVLGTGTLDGSGVTAFTTAALAGGAHTITAQYGGDAKHATAAATVAQQVDAAATTTVLVSSVAPSVFGQSITLSATVTSTAAGTRTGTVTFLDGATVLGTSPVAAGIATYTTTSLAVSTHPLSAVYGGDGNFATSTSDGYSLDVNRASTTTALASSSNPALVATSITLSATVRVTAPGAGVATGTVTFMDGNTALGTGTVNASGVATFAIATLTAGSHAITASYAGDGSFEGSTSPAFAQNVSASAATIALTAAPNPASYGQPTKLTARLAGTSGTPTGTVAYKDGTTELGEAPLDGSGVSSFSIATLGAGTHTITARYSGSTTYAWVVGSVSLVVGKAATTVTVTSSANPSVVGGDATFTATVASASQGFTGKVELFDGATSLGSMPLTGAVAKLSTKTLTQGGHAISATYHGDDSFAASTSMIFTQNVRAGGVSSGGVGPEGDPAGGGGAANSNASACGCRLTAPVEPGGAAFVLLAGALAFVGRRRRRSA